MLDVFSIPNKNTISNSISDVHNNIKIFPGNFESGFLEKMIFFVGNTEVYTKPCVISITKLLASNCVIVCFRKKLSFQITIRVLNTPLKDKEITKLVRVPFLETYVKN